MRNIMLLLAALAGAGTAEAQPVNDNCADAIVVGLGATRLDTTGATTDGPDEPGCRMPSNPSINQDIWYAFTPPTTDKYTLSMCGLAWFDTRLAVYAEACPVGPDEALACNDDDPNCVYFTSLLTFEAERGVRYLVRVGAFNADEGPGTLLISADNPIPPVNDRCEDAIAIGPETIEFDTTHATSDGPNEPGCGMRINPEINQDAWFSFTAPRSDTYVVSTCDMASFDTRLAVYADACPRGPDEVIACNDDDPACINFTSLLAFDAEQGEHYLIRVGGTNEGAGPGTLDISALPAPVENDDCGAAVPVEINSVTEGTTIGATMDEAPMCGTAVTAPGVWYSLTGNGGTVVVETCDEIVNYDSKINVYRDGCETLTCVGGDDDGCDNRLSRLLFDAEEGVTYLVLVQGFDGQTGDFKLTVSGACTGREKVKRPKCRTKRGQVKVVLVKIKKATPGQDYGATLDTGEVIIETAGPSGKITFRFEGDRAPACGPNGVTLCDVREPFDCGC